MDIIRQKQEFITRIKAPSSMTVLFSDISMIQKLVDTLLNCNFYLEQMDNVLILQCFKLLIGDMLALFHLLNEGIIILLGRKG